MTGALAALLIALAAPALSEAPALSRGLVGWWRFDEGAGVTARDASGKGNHGTLVNGADWTEGHLTGHAVALDGEDDHVVLPDMGTVEAYPFSFVAWIRTSSTEDQEMTAVIQEDNRRSSQRVQLYLSRRGEPKWNVRNGAEAEVVHPVDVRDGSWHFLAGVSHAADRHELYVDGSPARKSSAAVTPPAVNSATIGNWVGNRRHPKWFEGAIDDVCVYDRALSPEEIRELLGELPEHRLTVRGGAGSGAYVVGSEVMVQAGRPPAGKVFAGWEGDTATLAAPRAFSTTFVMPSREATLIANYQDCAEVLYNGIRLPEQWPPRMRKLPDGPTTPPYLVHPPEVIPIDVGRQLFVDDFLVEETDLGRTYHRPEFYEGNPVLTPGKPWEWVGKGPMAIPHSGGVCFDPADDLFKMWYITGYQEGVGLVTSADGLHWERPVFDHVQPGTNLVYDKRSRASTVWLDLETEDPEHRYVMFSSRPGVVWFSRDGVHWGESIKAAGPMSDRTTLFWNPFRKIWVYSVKTAYQGKRARRYWETPELVGDPRSTWAEAEDPSLWVGADSADPARADMPLECQLYDLDCVAYESILLGTFIIWRGDYRFNAKTEEAQRQQELGRPKQNSACIGFSRDGFHWHRPDRRVFLPKSDDPGAWNWGNSQTAAQSPLVVGDKLYFYVAGRRGLQFPGNEYQDAGGTTGVAFLRRDGFASMDAGPEGGTLTTRPLIFRGKHLFVNVDNPEGTLRVEVCDADGQPVPAFAMGDCVPVSTDSTLHQVTWRDAQDLSPLSGKPVRIRFHLTSGRLYAFWVTPDPLGASYGYVGGGGPGFTTNRDTIGARGL